MLNCIKKALKPQTLQQERLKIDLLWCDLKTINQKKANYHNFTMWHKKIDSTAIGKKELKEIIGRRKIYLETNYR